MDTNLFRGTFIVIFLQVLQLELWHVLVADHFSCSYPSRTSKLDGNYTNGKTSDTLQEIQTVQ